MIVTLKLYGDESADETQDRVFAVAGVVGSDDEWAGPVREWLRRTRGRIFHANRCESEYVRHHDRQKHKDNLKLYEDLTKILAGSGLVGFAVALDLRSHRELFPNVLPGVPYFKCLTDLLGAAGRTARRFNAHPDEPTDVRLEFTFASRLESDGTAGTLYTTFRNQPEWAESAIFGPRIAFDPGPCPRLEMADLLAREAMKELDRKVTNAGREPRRSFRALAETGRFKFIERDRAHCELWNKAVEDAGAEGLVRQYHDWLLQTRRVQNGRPHDNMTNRARFFARYENKEQLISRIKWFVAE